jgi:hypothetical protein
MNRPRDFYDLSKTYYDRNGKSIRIAFLPYQYWPLWRRIQERVYRWTHGGQIRTLSRMWLDVAPGVVRNPDGTPVRARPAMGCDGAGIQPIIPIPGHPGSDRSR